jgi:sarcosine oxidase
MTVASCDVAVIGLGIAGASAAWQLARRGHRVIALEQFAPGHDRGSSHGESRIIRLAYAEDPSYVPLLRAAYAGWRALEAETGREVMTVTGILEAGRPGAKLIAGSLASAHEHDLPHEVLSPAEVGRRFPAFRLPADWTAVWQPDGGFLRAEIAVSLLVERARHAGAVIRPGARVDAIEPGPTAVRLRIGDDVVEAGTVIVAAGSWNRELVPVLAPRLALTEQVLAWFAPLQPGLFVPGRFPVFILEGETNWYGFPDFAGTGLKVAAHRPGRPIPSPAALQQDAGPEHEARLRRLLESHLPDGAGALLRTKTCIYTNTSDEHFILDQHPEDRRIVLASACSGHGFKFGPALGEVLADLATRGETAHDIGLFRLAR